MTQDAIGVFDSGVGGLTVVKELTRHLPHENIVYFGDTARVPYGTKSAETILRYATENAIFLLKHKVKCIVIACNTATAYALEQLQHLFRVPVIGVINPGVKAALQTSKNHRIGIIGTTGTIQSGVYQNEIIKHSPNAKVFAQSCPLFVPLIEEGLLSHEATKILIKEYLAPLMKESIDTLLLGCTHYPLLAEQIQDVVGGDVTVINSAEACANEVKALLQDKQLAGNMIQSGVNRFFVSDDPHKFEAMAARFFGTPLSHIERIDLS
jgi:glutamate racemase